MKKEFQLTKSGVEDLESELKTLIESRPVIAEKIKTAREFGDLSENSEYQSAMEEHQKTEVRIGEIEHILKNAEVVSKPKNITEVEIGNHVKVKGPKGTVTYMVVGSFEANPSENKISNESPVGAALMGKGVGDSVEVGPNKFKVVDIH